MIINFLPGTYILLFSLLYYFLVNHVQTQNIILHVIFFKIQNISHLDFENVKNSYLSTKIIFFRDLQV